METTVMNESSRSVDFQVDSAVSAAALQAIAEALRGLRFGQVSVIVHDGHVVQIDRLEKHRLPVGKQIPPS